MKILHYIKIIFTAGIVAVFYHLFYILRYSHHPEKYPFELRYARIRKLCRIVFKAYRVDFQVEGIEKFLKHDGKCMLVANHLSDVDPLALIAISERPITFVAKKEAFSFPFIGAYLKTLGAISLDREHIMEQARAINKAIEVAKDPNKPDLVIFAEGTRNRVPGSKCASYKPGTIKVAMKADVDIIPIALYGTFRPFPKNIYMKSYPCPFIVLDPVKSESFKVLKSHEIASSIESKTNDVVKELKIRDLEQLKKQKMSEKRFKQYSACDLIEF